MTAVIQLLDAREASLAEAVSLARDLALALERYEALDGQVSDWFTAAILGELAAARPSAALPQG